MKNRSLPIVCAVFLVIAMTVQFIVSYNREKSDLVEQMEYKMELAQKDFIFEMYDMHEATDEITHYFPEFEGDETKLFALLETVLWNFPALYCCYVTFLPEHSPIPGEWSCPTAFRVNADSVLTYDALNTIPYAQRDWYQGALKSNDEGYWSLPYNDGTHADPVFTYSQKLYDKDGQLVGVAGSDYTLAWTKRLLEDIKPYDDAVCQLFSTDGTLIVGSGDTTKMRDMIVFEKVLSSTDMRLVLHVPKCHIRRGITSVSLITLSVLLAGILIIGLLLHHIKKERDAFIRIQTTNKLMEHEMQIAHDIQMGILKGDGVDGLVDEGISGLALEAKLIPMREVGGDLYDYHREGDRLWFIIGDVSGKGVPAAMFMSAAVNLFRAAGAHSDSPREIMEKMNAVLSENNPSLTFVTAFIGCLNIPTGELLYCNAGHCVPLRVSGLGVSGLDLVPNIPLGFDGKFRFVEQGVLLGQGDSIVLYTDGITEARNDSHQMLGMERWTKIVERVSGLVDEGVSGLVESLLADVKKFIGKAEQADDITLMTIRKTSAVEPVHMRLENRMDAWPQMRAVLHNYGLCTGMEPRALKKTEMAIEEAVVNIVNYSQATWMELKIKNEKLKIIITLSDDGIAFDPTQQAEVDIEQATAERQIGGLGIALLRKIADDVRYSREEEINTLTIIKKI